MSREVKAEIKAVNSDSCRKRTCHEAKLLPRDLDDSAADLSMRRRNGRAYLGLFHSVASRYSLQRPGYSSDP